MGQQRPTHRCAVHVGEGEGEGGAKQGWYSSLSKPGSEFNSPLSCAAKANAQVNPHSARCAAKTAAVQGAEGAVSGIGL